MTFLIDTSIMRPGRLRKMLEICSAQGHRILVPMLAYSERTFQLRRTMGSTFNQSVIDDWFSNFPDTLALADLDRAEADRLSFTLWCRFQTDEQWRSAKARVRNIDLFLAGLATPEAPLVTADKGPEWDDFAPGAVLKLEQALLRAQGL